MKTLVETCQTILDNPIEVFDKKNPNYNLHQINLKLLEIKGLIKIFGDKIDFDREELKLFIDNDGLICQERIKADEDRKQRELIELIRKSYLYVRVSLIVSGLAVVLSLISIVSK